MTTVPPHRLVASLVLTAAALAATFPAGARQAGGANHAFLVACGPYDPKELRPLPYAAADLTALQAALRDLGFRDEHIVHMDERQPRRYRPEAVKVRQELKRFLENLEPEDTAVVALAGHAVQFKGERQSYFCPLDARPEDRGTLLPLQEVNRLLGRCRAGRKLLLADVCRRDPRPAGAAGPPALEPVARPQDEPVPPGVLALFACAAGQEGHDDAALKHGVFFHHVVRGLRGEAASTGPVTPQSLVRYVAAAVPAHARRLGAEQAPVVKGEPPGAWVLRPAPPEPAAGAVRREPPWAAVWRYRLELAVRRPGQKDFSGDTPRVGLEVYRDPATDALVYVTRAGELGLARSGAQAGAGDEARWRYGFQLRARRAGEADFTERTRRVSVEVYRDDATGNLLYLTDSGTVAVAPPAAAPPRTPRDAVWLHGLGLRARRGGQGPFRDAAAFGVEVYQDPNTGYLIYLVETGALAVAPRTAVGPTTATHRRGLAVPLRKAGEADVTPQTRVLGVEVYRDDFGGNDLYLTETGHLAAAVPRPGPARKEAPGTRYALELRVRRAGETDFSAATRRLGVEVYRDGPDGPLLYVAETGAGAVLPEGAEKR